jgi:hypothetical protein
MSSISRSLPSAVYVTAWDLEQGRVARADACPIATAVRRALGVEAIVGRERVTLLDGSGVRCRTPPEARSAMSRWDRGELVEPFSFILSDWETPDAQA